ncbi:MAG TPA: ferredoxin [Nitrososphaerales archaeon]|nr:ferredoxin [Nitrososphaerales archaeon]
MKYKTTNWSRLFRFALIGGSGIIVAAAALIYSYYGGTQLLVFLEFISVPAAIALIIDTKVKKKFSSEKGGWWTGMVVGDRKVGIKVDWNSCMGAASCVELAPKVFRLDWEKKKSIFDPAPLVLLDKKGADPERIFYAAQSCPYRAIILEDEETGERIYP